MSKIIVTGATSFIGKNLIEKLLANNHEILAIVRESSNKQYIFSSHNNLRILELNMENYYKLSSVIKNNYDIFISLAWNGTRGEDRNNKIIQFNNYKYSLESINSAIKLGVQKIILAGSQAEYGVHNSIISEQSACYPETEYGKYKLLLYLDTCNICNKHDIKVVEPRFFSLYGPNDSEKTMIISILKKMLKNEDCELTFCNQTWNFMYVSDAIELLYKLIIYTNINGIYNFGSNDTRQLKLFIEEIKSISKSKSTLLFGKIPYSPCGAVNIMPNILKLTHDLKTTPKISFGEGIKNIIKTLKDR